MLSTGTLVLILLSKSDYFDKHFHHVVRPDIDRFLRVLHFSVPIQFYVH